MFEIAIALKSLLTFIFLVFNQKIKIILLKEYQHNQLMSDRVIKCFNCGGEGHFARECPSERQAPTRNNDRPDRRDRGDRGDRGDRTGGNTCFNCGKAGHFARDCEEPQKERPRREQRQPREPRQREPRERRQYRQERGERREGPLCYNCQKSGHLARDCKNDRRVECYNCKKEGHIARDCPEGEVKRDIECHKCHEKGHIAKNCTSN